MQGDLSVTLTRLRSTANDDGRERADTRRAGLEARPPAHELPALGVANCGGRRPSARTARFGGKIVPFKSIDGAALGMTPTQIRAALGKPAQIQMQGGRIYGYAYEGAALHIKGVTVTQSAINVYFDTHTKRDRADAVYGSSLSFHLPSGVHIDSTLGQLKHRYGGRLSLDGPGNYSIFKGAQGAIGTVEMNFLIVDHKVASIQLLVTYSE